MATPSPSDPSPPEANHYELLRVSESATPLQLRSAFRSLSKLYHPDTTSLPQAQAAQSFQRLQQAYAVLSDPLARRAYDLRRMGPGQPTAPISGAASAAPASASDAASRNPSAGFSSRQGDRPSSPSTGSTSVRRALSGGEWFALLLLAIALVLSLFLGIGLAWARGTELMRQPSWWSEPAAPARAINASMEPQSL